MGLVVEILNLTNRNFFNIADLAIFLNHKINTYYCKNFKKDRYKCIITIYKNKFIHIKNFILKSHFKFIIKKFFNNYHIHYLKIRICHEINTSKYQIKIYKYINNNERIAVHTI